MKLKVAAPKADGREIELEASIPQDLTELTEKYGEPVVVDGAVRSLRIQLQAFIRPMLEAGSTDEEIQEAVNSWMPGAKRDTFVSLVQSAKNLSPEKRAELAAQLGL